MTNDHLLHSVKKGDKIIFRVKSPRLMSQSSPPPNTANSPFAEQSAPSNADWNKPQPSYVKLAMRNMVSKGGKSLQHFFLTTVGLLAVLIGLAYLTR